MRGPFEGPPDGWVGERRKNSSDDNWKKSRNSSSGNGRKSSPGGSLRREPEPLSYFNRQPNDSRKSSSSSSLPVEKSAVKVPEWIKDPPKSDAGCKLVATFDRC